MAAYEGIRRIKLLAKVLWYGGIGSAVILGGSMLLARATDLRSVAYLGAYSVIVSVLFPLTIPLTLMGGALWILGWVLEGFFSPE